MRKNQGEQSRHCANRCADAFSCSLDTVAAPLLFDSEFLSKLEQLYLLSKKLFRGEHRAERKSRQIGSSLEFADYRNYTFGDDFRNVDWNIYGRLDRLFVKLFEEERDLHIYLLIDASASMRWKSELPARGAAGGSFPHPKLVQASRIAASLAYIGLANLDRVNLFWFNRTLEADMGLARGKSQFHKVLEFLRRVPQRPGETSLLTACSAFAARSKRRGLVFLVSDLFDPAGYQEALALLRYNQFDLHVIQILDPAELRPEAAGDLRLIDSESAAVFEVTADESLLRRYHESIDAFLEGLEKFCVTRGIGYVRASTIVPFEELVLRVLRDSIMIE
jgi:uncharacterized protein (DUF58 family)